MSDYRDKNGVKELTPKDSPILNWAKNEEKCESVYIETQPFPHAPTREQMESRIAWLDEQCDIVRRQIALENK